ncbi:porin [Vreelandella neptunia]|uniref:Porin n=1 Tax=Vreelandella neptunia TaxID=115551 RepID=A0ABZ0YSJ0_9GAMM|nr:porin [Halomonas neptunia]MDN3559237.1 porin [Halomonas neptunia]WQH14197.1 porin [Halomonas neptunia]
MHKKQLAVAVASLLSISSVQAAALYDQDGTKLDIYGRIAMGIAGGGPEFDSAGNKVDDGPEFVDVYSRLGFRMSHAVTSDLTALGHLEWRFTGDERNTAQGFNEIRQSYIGLSSKQYGTLLAGNFNSMYAQFVSLPFDVYQDRGLLFKSSGLQSWGDSIAYYTPELNGFTSFLQVKHYSERGLTPAEQSGDGSDVAAQGGIRYQQGPFKIGFGAVENAVRGGGSGNDEVLYGLIGTYALSDQLSLRLGIETQDNSDTYGKGFETVGLGGTYSTGPWAFTADYYNVDRDEGEESNAWAAGGYYKFSSAFDVFIELADSDSPSVRSSGGMQDMFWITGARYHF